MLKSQQVIMYQRNEAVRLIREFLKRIEKRGFSVNKSFLFGSYASGNAHEYSDIDLAVISDDFQGIRFKDVCSLSDELINFTDIELHPFRIDDFTQENPFAREIMRTGIEIFPDL